MTDLLRVGVIGAGVMGRDHARLLATSVAGARLTAIADVNLDGALAVAERHGAEGSSPRARSSSIPGWSMR
ncbi:Gfo/Idh/MocA family oxidoreductase [Tessaracoccus coleopterorum]|uniref:Gfo/Idh/MocA family oxidoreductase n=1 Tax=Tessaracoccus coleopterorum TaxID=2714950 RepID=UPI0018D3A4D1|nr:Gfo/Idh/MocA family oxidoreductase [Tessaracoccus coleopterorum]